MESRAAETATRVPRVRVMVEGPQLLKGAATAPQATGVVGPPLFTVVRPQEPRMTDRPSALQAFPALPLFKVA